jgi:enediyne biosynthesis protein E4
LLYGNYYGNNIQLGRYDADFGKLLINKGNCRFEVHNTEGVQIKGEVRQMLPISIAKNGRGKTFVQAINNEKVRIIRVDN